MNLPPGFQLIEEGRDSSEGATPPALPPGFQLVEEQTEQPAAQAQPQSQRGTFLDAMVGQGILLGFGDEIKGAVRGGIDYLQGEGSFGDMYAKRRDMARADQKGFAERNPVGSTALEIGGAIAAAPILPVASAFRGATMAGRAGNAALTGAGYGAAYGAGTGETGEERLAQGVAGAALGGVLGGVAAPVVEGVARGVSAGTGAVRNTVRGLINPEEEAARRIGVALQRDAGPNAPARAANILDRANQGNVPMVVADTGGETTRALARSAANTSQEGREALAAATGDRFHGQTERADTLVRALTGANADTAGTIDDLRRAATAANRPAYARAYRDGSNGVWTPELEQMLQAPAVQDAIRGALRTGGNRSTAAGFAPQRAPFEDINGRLTLRTNPDGSRAIPNLQFWDHVKRNLDDMVTAGQREGRGNAASDVIELRNMLRDHLDAQVPSYRQARAGAAAAFGAQDALEAGVQFVSSNMENAAARRAFNAMSQPEQALFRRGFANDLLDKISKVGDSRDLANAMFLNNPRARERIEIALGRDGATRLEAFVRIENIMNMTRRAVQGNSTTARQLAELGLAGGAGGAYNAATGGNISSGAMIGAALMAGGRYGRTRIDARVARRVGEMLASQNPQVLRQAAQMVARQPRLLNAIRDAEAGLGKLFAPAGGGGSSPGYGTVPARAEDQEQNAPRVRQ